MENDWAPSPGFERRIGKIEARTAVLENSQEIMMADVHEIRTDMKANTARTTANLWATIVGVLGVMATVLATKVHW